MAVASRQGPAQQVAAPQVPAPQVSTPHVSGELDRPGPSATPQHRDIPQTPNTVIAHQQRSDDDANAQRQRDAARIALALAGDSQAFRQIVDSNAQRVRGLAWRMLGDPHEAEDLAQDVFVSVYKALGTFRGDSQLSTWILRITRNHCLNHIKARGRRRQGHERLHQALDGGEPLALMHNPHADPEQILQRKQTQDWVQQAIAALPNEQRLLVILRDIEGLSYETISEVSELPIGTVKSRIHRARSRLVDWFQQNKPTGQEEQAPGRSR